MDDKVKIFGAYHSSKRKLSNWEGFEYFKTTKDVNGISHNFEHLKNYSKQNKYVVTVLREVNKKACLYNYYVKNEDLKKFFKSCFDGKIEGEIIEIEKFSPENLA